MSSLKEISLQTSVNGQFSHEITNVQIISFEF